MCLGIPMRVDAIDGLLARCSARGVEREVSLLMMGEDAVAVGDFVIAHLGYATQVVSAEEARQSWELFDQILADPKNR